MRLAAVVGWGSNLKLVILMYWSEIVLNTSDEVSKFQSLFKSKKAPNMKESNEMKQILTSNLLNIQLNHTHP
ncbi:MAG: hypothetical protein N0C90_08150 [Candidatus Thiodiazotropha endolucinida]|nr:hypothetical protein [Candidatus Thiodiazotropha taylori]MCW4261325.1 hypothetical protein [Candidatus Thiodiazotropha endolucinida]